MVVELRFFILLAGGDSVHAYIFGSGKPSDLIHSVAGQIMKRAGVGVGIKVPAVGRLPKPVRVRGDNTNNLTQISVQVTLFQGHEGWMTATRKPHGDVNAGFFHGLAHTLPVVQASA